MSKKRIYLDYATTTPLDPLVEREMRPYWSRDFGNPSSLHAEGARAERALSEVRTKIARVLQAHSTEIIFTASGTEANNLAILGYIHALEEKSVALGGMHVIASAIEHSSVRECLINLSKRGVKVTWLSVSSEGIISVTELEKLVTSQTVLVSIMLANNEIGTVQPVGRISALLKKINQTRKDLPIRLHTDACQASLYLNVNQNRLGADLITLDGHKMYGPKGIGILYVRRGTLVSALLYGGGQERGIRPGTENVPLAVGFAKAFELAVKRHEKESERITRLRDYFFSELDRKIPTALINGSRTERLPNNINFSLPGLHTEFTVIQLDALGIACSTKSACLEDKGESYVVKSLGRADGLEKSSLRFTLGRTSTKKDIDHAISGLQKILTQ
ncbi:MAG: hypothetical protein A3C06_00805 [Candidatus Taylorbacteria bacterium RIFCSPHIGHO2_02_FULL_46_13]|uniref:Aminotransferase class V domain-containing protein n=1 Tax=Candidatus Taylorbacteria bacterium RIFCSPHIGHO2_02_FULL_46_13 TaxID=1802312 RepID=A0A1G2MQF9_9BACT|nr:MAG: hypothetical protein A3C06_00805 [Candidatus Taylorbacteria bacterium RIFCSPHIGHO2_02_FULL_46_13]